MALVLKPNKRVTNTNSAGVVVFQHIIQPRYASVPRRSQVCPHGSLLGISDRIFQGELQGPASQAVALSNQAYSGGSWHPRTAAAQAQSLNKAYDKFRSSVQQTAELGVNLAERKQAVNMIVDRVTALRLGYLDLRKGRFNDFLRRFRLRENRGGRRNRWTRPRDASALWLEYHFGWKPLITDIYEACEILQSPFGYDRPVRGTGTGTEVFADRWAANGGGLQGEFVARTLIQARVTVTNPNLHRATQLGLTNPVAIAWELVPFSFLVDWFIPVGNFLNSWSDFNGLTFEHPMTTRYNTFKGVQHGYMLGYPKNGFVDRLTVVNFIRSVGIAKPVVYPKVFKGFSVTRAATAISLLLTVFKP